jgi:vacuolar-type H+-ATPase subunit I/STV1
MILWPRTECEAGVERAENSALKLENRKLRTLLKLKEESAELYCRKYQETKRRIDELATLDSEREANANLTAEVERMKSLRFPVELRKMWSGSEVQQWLDEQFAK